jgi:hypothetical protein
MKADRIRYHGEPGEIEFIGEANDVERPGLWNSLGKGA